MCKLQCYLFFALISLSFQRTLTQTIPEETTKTQTPKQTLTEYGDYDDDDYIGYNNEDINYGYGIMNLDINIYWNYQCIKEPLATTYAKFYYPNDCTCVNSRLFCWYRLLETKYFFDYNWTQHLITNNISEMSYIPEEYINISKYKKLNISSCIIQNKNNLNNCIHCDNYFIKVHKKLKRGVCVIINIFMSILAIVFILLIFNCIMWLFFSRHRFRYNSLPNTENDRVIQGQPRKTRFRFYTRTVN